MGVPRGDVHLPVVWGHGPGTAFSLGGGRGFLRRGLEGAKRAEGAGLGEDPGLGRGDLGQAYCDGSPRCGFSDFLIKSGLSWMILLTSRTLWHNISPKGEENGI
jgi:hypothetical protein